MDLVEDYASFDAQMETMAATIAPVALRDPKNLGNDPRFMGNGPEATKVGVRREKGLE